MSSLRCNLDPETAFDSVSHELILDMLSHCKVYHKRSSHIFNLYSKLTAYVRKKKWSTSRVSIGRGVSLPSHILCFLQSHYPPGPLPKILWNSPESSSSSSPSPSSNSQNQFLHLFLLGQTKLRWAHGMDNTWQSHLHWQRSSNQIKVPQRKPNWNSQSYGTEIATCLWNTWIV